jgi:hypothetical protein
MYDFVCEKPFSNRMNWLQIESVSRLERVKGIEPSFTRAVRRKLARLAQPMPLQF